MSQDEIKNILKFGFGFAAFWTLKNILFFSLNFGGLGKSTLSAVFADLPLMLFMQFVGAFLIGAAATWFLFQLAHLFTKGAQDAVQLNITGKRYFMDFLKLTGIFISTVILSYALLYLIGWLWPLNLGPAGLVLVFGILIYLAALAVLWLIFSLYILWSYKNSQPTDKGIKTYIMINIVIVVIGVAMFFSLH